MNWPVKKLGDLTFITTGKLDANASDIDGAYPFFTCAMKPLLIDKFAFDCEAVLIAGNGDLNVKYYEGKFNAYQRTYVIQSKDKSKLSVRFLFHFLDRYVLKLREMSIGGVIKYIKLPYLTDAEIPLPPLAEQQRIAALLDTADRILKQRESAIAKLDQLAQSVFVDMFGDPKSTTRWDRKEIAMLGKVYTGKTPSTSDQSNFDGDVPFVTPTDLRGVIKDSTRKISLKGAETITVVRGGSSLVGCIGDVGRVGYVTTPVTFNQQINAVVWNNELVLDVYGFYVLQYMASVFKNKSVSAVVPILNKTNFSSVNIPVPSINEQIKFVNFINSLWSLKEKMISERESELVSSLQHQSFTVN